METHVIETMGLTDSDHAFPVVHLSGRMSGQRKDAAVQGPTQKNGLAVKSHLCALRAHLAHAECHCSLLQEGIAPECQVQIV